MPNDNENELKSSKHHTYSHTLTLLNVTKQDSGAFLCHFPENEQEKNLTIVQVSFDVVTVSIPTIKSPLFEEIKINEKDGKSFTLTCDVEAFPSDLFNNSIKWTKETVDYFENRDAYDATEINAVFANKTKIITNDTHITVTVTVDKATKKHNGTYTCNVVEPMMLYKSFGKRIEKRTSVLIQSAPIAMITFAKAIGKNRIFFNWTVTDNGNSPISIFLPQFKVRWGLLRDLIFILALNILILYKLGVIINLLKSKSINFIFFLSGGKCSNLFLHAKSRRWQSNFNDSR